MATPIFFERIILGDDWSNQHWNHNNNRNDKKQRFFDKLSDLFRDSIQITVDEKITMLYNYALFPPQGTSQQIDLIMSRIKSDLNSLVRVKNRMTSDQWVEVNREILTLIE